MEEVGSIEVGRVKEHSWCWMLRTPVARARYSACIVMVEVALCFGGFRERGGRSRVRSGAELEVPRVLRSGDCRPDH